MKLFNNLGYDWRNFVQWSETTFRKQTIGTVSHKEIILVSHYSSYFLQINFHKIFVLSVGSYHHFIIVPCRGMIEVEREKQAVRVGEVIIDESLLSMEERENGSFLKSPQSNIICDSYSLLVFSQIIKKNLLCVSDHALMLLQ